MSDERPHKRRGPLGLLIDWYKFDSGLVIVWAILVLVIAALTGFVEMLP